MTDTQSQRIHAIVYSNDSREELAERIVALEDGYGSMSREHSLDLTELSDAYYEIDRLKAENEKLREQIYLLKKGDVLHVLTDQELADQQRREREMQASITALENENAKLRELVRGLWYCTDSFDNACGRCPLGEAKGRMATCEEMVRELGIEVNA